VKDDLVALKGSLEQLKAVYYRQRGEERKILEKQASLQESLKEIHEEGECLEQVRLLLLEAAKHAREQGRRQVELLVTQALQFVFGADMEFKVVVEEKRDRPEAEFFVCSTYEGDYKVETTPEDARGGGVNIANVELKGGMGMSEVSLEQVLAWDPDVIITWNQEQSGYYPQLLEDPKWKELKAVKEGKVYEIPCAPFSWFDRPPSVNRILGLKWLGNALYPDIYNYDLTKEIKEFYSLFYHSDISDQDAKDLLKNAVPKK
jgi:hypothetical protein